MSSSPTKTFTKQKSFTSSPTPPMLFIYVLIMSTTLLAFIHVQALKSPPLVTFPSASWRRKPRTATTATTFLPLKDVRFSDTPMDGHTWFMSSINDTYEEGETEYLSFPSTVNSRLLCLAGNSISNGTLNSYTFANPDYLPSNAKLLPGLTFISDTYYDYDNIWHGLSAVVPFVAWHGRKDCVQPSRWVLYHQGEIRMKISPWVKTLMKAVFGKEMELEGFEKGSEPRCFESAVVFRHQEGEMVMKRKEEVYEMMRCKAREYCGFGGGDEKGVRLTLLLRTGKRSFKDDAGVIRVFGRECGKVEGCRLKVERPENLKSFCDQVKLLSGTDILASPHGAQMTNMVFMDKNSRVMEFFPKGWKELAGVGQHVFHWIADSADLKHVWTWNDPKGDKCPHNDDSKCWSFYKDRKIGHDESILANWSARVIKETMEYKIAASEQSTPQPRQCSCI